MNAPEVRKPVTISDVARAAGVSPATVSRVLNHNPTVAPELSERVQQAILAVNYRPNSAGRALRRQRSDLWAAIVPDVRNPFFHRMIEAFERVAHAEGYSVVLCNSQEDLKLETSAMETVAAHQVSGVMIAAVSASQTRVETLESAGIPVVSVDRRMGSFMGDSINVDNEMIGWMAAEELLRAGRTGFLMLSHDADLTPMRERERGFERRLAEAGVPRSRVGYARLPFHDPRTPDDVEKLLRNLGGVDAVFAATNTLTAEAYTVLRRAGHRIGVEVALIGVDDDQWNEMVDPAVSVVDQPAFEVGQWAGQLLAARIAGRSMRRARIVLDPVLKVRGSSQQVPEQVGGT